MFHMQNELYRATHIRSERREKWSRAVFLVKMIDNGAEFECECGMFEHLSILCCHVLKVCTSKEIVKLIISPVLGANVYFFCMAQVMDYLHDRDTRKAHCKKVDKRCARCFARSPSTLPARPALCHDANIQE